MKKLLQLALFLSLATIGYAQGNPTPYLLYTLAGGILTLAPGTGVAAPGSNPPPLLCETVVGGALQYCSFSGQTPYGVIAGPRPLTPEAKNYLYGHDTGSVTDYSNMSRWCYTAENSFTTLQLKFRASTATSNHEAAFPNAYIARAALEFPVGTVSNQMTTQGQSTWVVQPWGNNLSDPIGAVVAAGSAYCIRMYERVSAPPATPSASPTSATVIGLLSTSTTYHYMVTAVDNGIESGPTADFTCATSTSTACTLAWTVVANGTPSAYNVYRGASATANQHFLVGSAIGTSTGWVDEGLTAASVQFPPATALGIVYNDEIATGDSATTTGSTANVADSTGSTGALANAGPATKFGVRPFMVLTNDSKSHPVFCAGDSICAGLGILANFNLASGNQATTNFFAVGFPTGTWNTVNLGLPGLQACAYSTQSQLTPWISAAFDYSAGAYVMHELARNDLYTGTTWQNTALCVLANAQAFQQKGAKIYAMTVGPNTTSTDDFLTVANQTAINAGYETARENFNTWVRLGSQVTAGTPCNTAACGVASPYISGYFDFAAALGEVNSSGVATPNGGYWPAATTFVSGVTLTSGATTTSLPFTSQTFTLGCCGSYVVQDTTLGQIGQVSTPTNTTTLTMFANGASRPTNTGTFVGFTTPPSSGDIVNILIPQTLDGVHPSNTGHATAGAALNTWATSSGVVP